MSKDESREPKQKTQPKGKDSAGRQAQPIEIPVPKRSAFDKIVKKAAKRRVERPSS